MYRVLSSTRALCSQVTRSSASLRLFHSLHRNHECFPSLGTRLMRHFSSLVEANACGNLLLDGENPFEKSNSKLTHESVVYALKKLSKAPEKALKLFKWVSEKDESKVSGTTYSLILRILVHEDWVKEFWLLLGQMASKGYRLDKETFDTLSVCFRSAKMVNEAAALREFYAKQENQGADGDFSAAVKILLESEWNKEVEKSLEEQGALIVSREAISKILKEVRGNPLQALAFFRWVQQHPDYKPSSVNYNAMLRVLGREDSIKNFWDLAKEMKVGGYEMDIDTYVKVLRQFLKRRMIMEAVELHEMMMAGPYKPSIQDCNLLLKYIAMDVNPDLDLVYRVVKNYEAFGFSRSKAIYDGLHRSLTAAGRFDEAEKIVETMKSAGFEPDNITYSQLVFGLCRFGRLDEACGVLDDMEQRGCKPDIKTWTILIQGHCLLGEIDKALLCLTNMIERDYDADADLLEVLVNALLSKNRVDSAYNLVVEMVEKANLRPWQATYKQLIERLLNGGKLEESFKVLRLMKTHNYPPYADPFVKYISKFGSVEDAAEYFRALSVKRFPSSTSYHYLFSAFFKEGRLSEAQDLLFKSPHHIRNHQDILHLFGGKKVEKDAGNLKTDQPTNA